MFEIGVLQRGRRQNKIAFSEVNYTFDEQLSGSFSTLKYCEGKLINCRRKNVPYAFWKIACLFLAKF